mmetsp:Transcript_25066/g.72516  ORF Transcript_25066/g.72516 Transcript_25066/m.72516 type:complete len:434 (-) Transcript_25066:169-1470(-)
MDGREVQRKNTVRTARHVVHVGRSDRPVLGRRLHHVLDGVGVGRLQWPDGQIGNQTRSVGVDLDLVLLLANLLVAEQIPNRLVVDLEEGHAHLVLPTLGLELSLVFADPLNGARNNTAHITETAALHGVRLTGAGLTITEEADVVPVESGLDEFRHLREHGLLGNVRLEHLVEGEAVLLLLVALEAELEGNVVGLGDDGGLLVGPGVVAGEEGTDSGEDADVAPELLDGVVQLPPFVGAVADLGLEVGLFGDEGLLRGDELGFFGLDASLQRNDVVLELGNGLGVLGTLLGLVAQGLLEGGNLLFEAGNGLLRFGHVPISLLEKLLHRLGLFLRLGLEPLLQIGNGLGRFDQLLLLGLEKLLVRLGLFGQLGLEGVGGLLPLGLVGLVRLDHLRQLVRYLLGRFGIEPGGIVGLVVELLLLAVELETGRRPGQ